MMSLLLKQLRLPLLRIRAAQRPCVATYVSHPPTLDEPLPDGMELFEELSVPTPTPAASTDLVLDEDYPPVAPENGYGAPQPPQTRNPMTPRSTFDVVKSKPQYMVFVKATRNNTTTTLTKPNGDPIITLSGGKVGFKSSNRASYEAGYQCIVGIFKQLELEMNKGDLEWQLYLKGFGQGRDAAYRALIAAEGTTVKQFLTSVTDRSPIKIGGTRGKKARRL